ncbi:hypothetical protein DQ04_05711040 [Trypanosoma grayi]|uniref:hypothetical protein n=1 Tax=Trypanosoma grayi TaxID=71804 RepID=UPI0004F4631F|nr:hypothetical protein DQ04_05711040 [Trypanosoma grayi]KEG09155.1 hypothetical protein DQ04_05711040 [Trypanosoma grayi]
MLGSTSPTAQGPPAFLTSEVGDNATLDGPQQQEHLEGELRGEEPPAAADAVDEVRKEREDATDKNAYSEEGEGDTGAEEPPPSAMKGKSGRERSTDLKPRFNPEVTVMETSNYALVMQGEEGDDEAAELAVFDRLYDEAKKRAGRAKVETPGVTDNADAEAAAKEAEECTFRPALSDAAKELGRYATWGDFLATQEERRKTSAMHFEKKKEKLLSDEILPLFDDMPRKHSLRIIAHLEKERNYKGPIKGWRARFRAYMQRLQEQDVAAAPNQPRAHADTPSVHSGIVRDDAVFDRLYEEATVREAAQRVLLLTQLEKEARELYHPVTNESEYWSRLGGNNNSTVSSCSCSNISTLSSRTSTVFDELYAMSAEYRRRRELRAAAAAGSEEVFPFRPVTNPQSSRIIMKRAISRAKGEVPERSRKPPAVDEAVESPNRKKNARFNTDIFCSRLQRKELERLERLAALRRQTWMEEAVECTFRPAISRHSNAIAVQKGYGQITFVPTLNAPPRDARTHTADGADADASTQGVSQLRQPQGQTPLLPQRNRGASSRSSSLNKVPKTFDSGASSGDCIAALSSEIQGVLSAWSHAVEEARAEP